MRKLLLPTLVLILIIAGSAFFASAAGVVTQSNGSVWFVAPGNGQRYALTNSDDALNLMRKVGIGISGAAIKQIPIGVIDIGTTDNDSDGLNNELEKAISTDPNNADTDGDDISDYAEVLGNTNPLGRGALPINWNTAARAGGKIVIETQRHGEAWYINPKDNR
ncbi:MAG: hypothetical protein V1763_00275, partial [Parcubacteria group bacterium]